MKEQAVYLDTPILFHLNRVLCSFLGTPNEHPVALWKRHHQEDMNRPVSRHVLLSLARTGVSLFYDENDPAYEQVCSTIVNGWIEEIPEIQNWQEGG